MAEDVKPTLDEEKEEPKEPTQTTDIDGLLAQLEAAGVSSKEQLQGKLQASQEVGRMAQLLGETRHQNEELKSQLTQLMQMQQKGQNDYDDYNGGNPINLEDSLERAVEKVFSKKEKAQAEAQQRMYSQWNKIQSDEDYHLVKGVWEEKMKDPNFGFQVQAGTIDPVDEYAKIVRKFYKDLAIKAAGGLKQFKEAGGSDVKPPHVETGEVHKEPAPDPTETEEIMGSLKAKVDKGGRLTEDEELKALSAILGLSGAS